MTKLPEIDLTSSPEATDVFERVAASRGWVSNLMRSMAHSPDALRHYSALGHYGRYGTALTEVQRELAIVATVRSVEYGWTHHSGLARAIGVTEPQLESIKAGVVPTDLDAAEQALCKYVFAFTACRGVSDVVVAELLNHFGPRQVVDVAVLSAYYMAAGALIIGLGVEIEPPDVLKVELDWQKRMMAQASDPK